MDSNELIQIARECGALQFRLDEISYCEKGSVVMENSQLEQFAQRILAAEIETLRGVVVGYKQRIAELEQCIDRQAKAALSGMDSAKAHGVEALKIAKDIHRSLKPELIESERAANAALTEENEQLANEIDRLKKLNNKEYVNGHTDGRAAVFEYYNSENQQLKQRIDELEKDADILQTNLDAALSQISLLKQTSIAPEMRYATADDLNKFAEDVIAWNHRNKLE